VKILRSAANAVRINHIVPSTLTVVGKTVKEPLAKNAMQSKSVVLERIT